MHLQIFSLLHYSAVDDALSTFAAVEDTIVYIVDQYNKLIASSNGEPIYSQSSATGTASCANGEVCLAAQKYR